MNFLDTEGLRTYTERLLEIVGPGGGGNIDLTDVAKEQTLLQESEAIKQAVQNVKGENQEATSTAILEAVSNIVDTKNLYSVRFESNDDGPNTYTMVLPVVAGVVGDTIIL